MDSEIFRDWLLTLKERAQDIEVLSENQPFATDIGSQKQSPLLIQKYLTEFDAIIRNTYGPISPDKAHGHYSHLLDILQQQGIHFLPFFTTNYDLVLESLAGSEGLPWYIETGMVKKGIRVALDEQSFKDISRNKDTLHLFKLHGSTDWWRNTQTNEIEHVRYGISPGNEYQELLIYPTREKFHQVEEEPFSFFYNMLKSYLSTRALHLCIVIGYSFRDSVINKLITPAIERGLRLLVIDNEISYEQLKQRLKLSKIESKVRIENIKFGHWNDAEKANLANILNHELGHTR